ncbi:MAG: UDP-N-acetylmuramoyl-tripeptide--D-alanyl-D-alanine ligase [Paludibacterium sp.]|uniref:UDP-N-acetylmuramoyl-tripeptide--D-alanyl-D- alanine ligase n=1 Tax=Paludibacterium sp. TaxID=1917523 RepID=UPI0025DF711E|nr:UDP-N-acetylmuramoyl-tripeptide--D-alanyl-D-alanine ligase [Paludibacterium sp.]MBV8048333.1 UDP-N-acetylmuramoyl-tripeptide--D-alanyl-D-alanine ligase [Paludibacterium sp.]MBV8649382.1 UDP-N-acetylmuramoyl-tripeptide--D-alanyl-D-alanine ligase [Paludibacterium sp.]
MMTLSEAARLAGGVLQGSDAELARVVTDSRSVQPGDLFLALKGERFDAHDFVAGAIEQGAVGAIVAEGFALEGVNLITVDDTRLALGRLAAGWRARFDIPLIGITGSNGKTTVKEMLAAILRAHVGQDAVLVTAGNFNNDIGLPLTLLGMNDKHRFAVIEMGMNHSGELTYLAGLARPDVALVNNALRAHLGQFDSVESIARAKAEIFDGLTAEGVAVFNAEDPNAALFAAAAGARRTLSFGLKQGDIRAQSYMLGSDGSSVAIATPLGELSVRVPAPGEHNVKNALAAVSLALALNVPEQAISRGLMQFSGVNGRLQKKTAKNGATVLDDTYNANPDSMRAGLEVLSRLPAPRWFVMGDMGELGEGADALHAEVGQAARALGTDMVVTLGEASRHACEAFGAPAKHFEAIEPLLAWLDKSLPFNATVLVKGSHFMNMDRVVDHLVAKKGN